MPKRKLAEFSNEQPRKSKFEWDKYFAKHPYKSNNLDWDGMVARNELQNLRKPDLQKYFKRYRYRLKIPKRGSKQILIDRIKAHVAKRNERQALKKEKEAFDAEYKNIRSMFNHPKDHKQFMWILSQIERNKLIKMLEVPPFVILLIAEYSTGEIHYCDGSKCKKEILFLQSDHCQLTIQEDVFRHIKHNDLYYILQWM